MNYLNELKKLEILYVDNYQYIEIKKLNIGKIIGLAVVCLGIGVMLL